jgi:dephospho-CoA kinase
VITVGLTGGIGSGKSTVSRLLAGYGAVVVDADLIAREVVEPGTPGLAAVAHAFGPGVLQADGSLDREALGKVVFGDDAKRAVLAGILHPLIGTRSAELMAAAQRSGAPVLVHDVPLLTENHLASRYAEVIVVDVSPEVQLDRLVSLRGMTRQDAENRVKAQATREGRLAIATKVLHNDGTPAELETQVARLWAELVQV